MLGFGCAAARVENVQAHWPVTLPRPGRVVVFDLETGAADVRVDRSLSNRAKNAVGLDVNPTDVLAAAVADSLSNSLVEDIKALGLAAVRAAKAAPPEINDLVIQGQFLRIDEGSRNQGFVIGFDAGTTDLRTQIEVFQVTAEGWRPVKQFNTSATSSRMSGVALSVGVGVPPGKVAQPTATSSSSEAVQQFRTSIEADSARSSVQIAARVAEVFNANHW
jgi:hypothetical protein